MQKKQIILFLLSTIFLLPSCYKQIEIEFPNTEPVFVLNCLFTADSIFKVKINKTSDFNDSISYPVTDAVCKLYADNKLIENLIAIGNNGFYISQKDYKPLYNTTYRIEVSSPSLPTAFSSNQLPHTPQILNITKQDSVLFDEDGNSLNQLDILIKDPIDVSNYYELIFFSYFKLDYTNAWWLDSTELENVDTNYHAVELFCQTQDMVFKNEGLLDYSPIGFPFSDEIFDGQTYNLKINYQPPAYFSGINDYLVNIITDYSLIICVRAVTESYYHYKQKLIVHQANQYSDFWDGIAEPVQMFTNVENGYGIFAGYSTFVDTIQ